MYYCLNGSNNEPLDSVRIVEVSGRNDAKREDEEGKRIWELRTIMRKPAFKSMEWLFDLLGTITIVIIGLNVGVADSLTSLMSVLTFAFSLNIHYGVLFGKDITMGGFSVTPKEKGLRIFYLMATFLFWYVAFICLYQIIS